MNVPANLKYSNDHEWCRVEGDTAVIGITDFAQSQLGDIVFVDVPTVGETLAAGEVFGSIEAVKTVSDAFLPIGGEILEFNDAVDADRQQGRIRRRLAHQGQDDRPGRVRRTAERRGLRKADRLNTKNKKLCLKLQ